MFNEPTGSQLLEAFWPFGLCVDYLAHLDAAEHWRPWLGIPLSSVISPENDGDGLGTLMSLVPVPCGTPRSYQSMPIPARKPPCGSACPSPTLSITRIGLHIGVIPLVRARVILEDHLNRVFFVHAEVDRLSAGGESFHPNTGSLQMARSSGVEGQRDKFADGVPAARRTTGPEGV